MAMAGGQVSERALLGRGGGLFLSLVVWLELEAASAYLTPPRAACISGRTSRFSEET